MKKLGLAFAACYLPAFAVMHRLCTPSRRCFDLKLQELQQALPFWLQPIPSGGRTIPRSLFCYRLAPEGRLLNLLNYGTHELVSVLQDSLGQFFW